jgi:hypothetical protein
MGMTVYDASRRAACTQNIIVRRLVMHGGITNRMLRTLRNGVVTPFPPNYTVRGKERTTGGKNTDDKAKAVVFAPLPPDKLALGTWGRQAEILIS